MSAAGSPRWRSHEILLLHGHGGTDDFWGRELLAEDHVARLFFDPHARARPCLPCDEPLELRCAAAHRRRLVHCLRTGMQARSCRTDRAFSQTHQGVSRARFLNTAFCSVQTKILTTAVFSVAILGRSLHPRKW